MSLQKKGGTVELAAGLAAPVLERLGLELWDVRFEKEGSQWYLRYFIDREGGVTIQDCEDVSRALDTLLDEADPIQQSYILEVGSPGIERELVKEAHFQRYLGHDVTVRLIRAVEGKRDFTGRLLRREGKEVTILLEGETEMTFSLQEAAFVRLHVDFDDGGRRG